uniref:Deacetylase sirtuin-type domain-containing protein n=1 Tax=Palpitomonas bilix TaxID=652834 RepID=A0A7S3G3Y3_9EUKA|mmetsp:Transcript_26926/g.69232  ORF Transcript_26926/g.69232 Transcript_26926/m.69232 type:complete len:240 (+) Transcript_26926:210-929(+)
MQKGVADALRTAAKAISQARALVITAGAGLGVDSGLPDFRGKEGFWKAYPHFEKLGYSFVQMANPAWFENDPQLAWGFYGHRLKLYKDTQPHEGYHLLRKWANACEKGGFVVTSNVDGHFAKAGFDIDRLYEVHGSINYVQCTAPHRCAGGTAIMPSPPPSELEVNMDTLRVQAESVPKCPQAGCGKVQRPAILLFNDYHWASDHFDEQGNVTFLPSLPSPFLIACERVENDKCRCEKL